MTEPRIICRFSCGAASAVATKLALGKYGHDRVEITYSDTGSEHPDNKRFLADCEKWFGKSVTILKSEKYADTWAVWKGERFIASQAGAPCTGFLKREPAYAFERPTDILVFGYTADEVTRAERIRKQNFERVIETPLIERGLGKEDCLGFRIGLISYPRFPTTHEALHERALALAESLMHQLFQQSYSIVGPDQTEWFSRRPADV